MKLSQYAKVHGVTYRTAWAWFKAGKIDGAYRLGNSIFIKEKETELSKPQHTVVYSRVSNSENKSNLESQAARLIQFCNANGWVVNQVVKECASGLNDNRPKLQKLLQEKKATRLVVEHKDRLTRFGFNYIKTLLDSCEIIVINQEAGGTTSEDLMEDFVSLVTSFCARIYGRRRSKRQTEKLIEELTTTDGKENQQKEA